MNTGSQSQGQGYTGGYTGDPSSGDPSGQPYNGTLNTNTSGTTTLRNVPEVIAPSIVGGNPCSVGASGGGAVAGFGISFGATWADRACERRQESALLLQHRPAGRGGRAALPGRRCGDGDDTAGTGCPVARVAEVAPRGRSGSTRSGSRGRGSPCPGRRAGSSGMDDNPGGASSGSGGGSAARAGTRAGLVRHGYRRLRAHQVRQHLPLHRAGPRAAAVAREATTRRWPGRTKFGLRTPRGAGFTAGAQPTAPTSW